jgi:uncharacterized protein YndB with AHSA1/START domain
MKEENKTREVEITYTFNAPRSDVFNAWTNQADLEQWFAPHGCVIKYKKFEFKVGGTFHSRISNPQYGDCWCIGEYKEIAAPAKIVYTLLNADENGNPIDPKSIGIDPEWPGETLVSITFSENEGKTTIILKQNAPETIAKKTGAYPSWIQMLERLDQTISN